jgi:hypothetical protein
VDVAASLAGPTGNVDLGYGAAVAKEGITIARNSDRNKLTIGADGSGMNSLNADRSGLITVRLLKIAPANAVLMQMLDAQQLSSSLWGQNTIVIRQLVSGDISTSSQCSFKKVPEIVYAEEGGLLVWEFDSINIGSVLGTF